MIQSILDNDLYKFTMQQAVLRLYPEAEAQYRFTNRGGTPFPPGTAEQVAEQIRAMAGLTLTAPQQAWLKKTCPYFETDYLEQLYDYRFDPEEVSLVQDGPCLDLIVQGPWHRTILWEVPLMAVISETYFALTAPETLSRDEIRERNQKKARFLAREGVAFADFGTRRRFSFINHDHLIQDILSVEGHTLTGTSNVHLAWKRGLPPVGTMAHEWIMFHSVFKGYSEANALAMDAWKRIYPEVLGIALTDTYTTDEFLKTFTPGRADSFAGVRQDSGDPMAFAQKLLTHYRDAGIDPGTKTVVFSDGLDVERAAAIHRALEGEIRDDYGIGTHLTNDIGPEPLNIVIKLSACRSGRDREWLKTVKLSDDSGKHTGDGEEINACLKELNLT